MASVSEQANSQVADSSARALPLYVDLDGTLTYSDLLFESFLVLVKRNPLYVFCCMVWVLGGYARLKAEIARRVVVDPALLPYNEEFIDFLRRERARGRRLVLASASNEKLVKAVSDHVGVFDAWIASDDKDNLKSARKLEAMRAHAGGPFAYAANASADLVIWEGSAQIVLVNAAPHVHEKAKRIAAPAMVIPPRRVGLRVLAKALRLHQWAKNVLLFVPLLAAHSLDSSRWSAAFFAFVAFGLCASATYVINDLLDLAADRQHPRKRNRAFAASYLSIKAGFALVAVLLPFSLLLAWLISPMLFVVLAFYSVVTLAYSMRLKRVTFIDVLVLAFLYTYRVIAGGVATDVSLSNWLLTVSMFIFLSLALVKRCAELEQMSESGKDAMAGRGYRRSDLPYLMSMGIASGFVATMVLALYIDSQAGAILYPNAGLLWLMLPVLLYWIMRLWIKTSRMEIHDDPLQFALTDPPSWVVGVLIALIALAASIPLST